MRLRQYPAAVWFIIWIVVSCACAFPVKPTTARSLSKVTSHNNNNQQPPPPPPLDDDKDNNKNDDDNDEESIANDSFRLENGIDKNLLFPAITLRRESILFGQNPATRYDSRALRAWRATKRTLPRIVTGARAPHTADDNPMGGFYNMLFVRLPTLAAGLVYAKNIATGHPLVIDVGAGPTEVTPLLVATVLLVILR